MKMLQKEFEFMRDFHPKKKPATKNLSFEERQFIENALNKGISIWSISEHLGRWPSGIENEVRRGKIDGKYNAEKAQEKANNSIKFGKNLTFEQRKIIEIGLKNNVKKSSIMKKVGVSGNTFYSEIKRGKINGEYNAEYAENKKKKNSKITMEEFLEKQNNLELPNLENKENEIENKIKMLENQIKMLTEIIKESLHG